MELKILENLIYKLFALQNLEKTEFNSKDCFVSTLFTGVGILYKFRLSFIIKKKNFNEMNSVYPACIEGW